MFVATVFIFYCPNRTRLDRCSTGTIVGFQASCDFFRLDAGLGGNVRYAHAISAHEADLEIVCSHDFIL
jgi:hypothetical protein